MNYTELQSLLETSGFPVAQEYFPEKDCPQMPFIVWQDVGTHNMFADGHVYQKITKIQIDLYCSKKDVSAEQALEQALINIAWEKTPYDEDNEQCIRIMYEIEIVKTEENQNG